MKERPKTFLKHYEFNLKKILNGNKLTFMVKSSNFHLIFLIFRQEPQGWDSLDWLNPVIDSLYKKKTFSPQIFIFNNLLGKILAV